MNPQYLDGSASAATMAKTAKADGRSSGEMTAEKKHDERVFYLMFVLSFPLFLVAVLAGRLMLSAEASGTPESRVGKSIIAEASAKTRSTIASAWTG